MGSTRLPGKVLFPFGGTTLLGWIVERLRALPWTLLVATSSERKDDAIEVACNEYGVLCARGSEEDVLDRYWRICEAYRFDHVVRLTADNPFPDVEELSRLIDFHLAGGFDYSSSFGVLPVGVGAEVFSAHTLSESWAMGSEPHHREHVNEFVIENPERFRIGTLEVPSEKRCSGLSFTIDTPDDFRAVARLVDGGEGVDITTQALISKCISSV